MSVSYPDPIELDWRGMSCPEPILKTARAARDLEGQFGMFKILADDEAFPMDLKSWCRSAKAEVLNLQQVGDTFEATVAINRKRHPAPAPVGRMSLRGLEIDPETDPPSLPTRREFLDLRGQQCPQPILQMARTLRGSEGILEIEALADDPAFPMDVESWARSARARVVSMDEENGAWRVLVRHEGKQPARKPEPPTQPAATIPRPAPPLPATLTPGVSTLDAAPAALQMDLSGLPVESWRQRLAALEQMGLEGGEVLLRCQEPAFNQTLIRWCGQGGHEVLQLQTSPMIEARVRMGAGGGEALVPVSQQQPAELVATDNRCTLLVLHNDFEALMAALMTATAAAAGGMQVEIFFSFWGVNLLRADKPQSIAAESKPSLLQRMFAWMMPKGPQRQQLGKLNFGGMGTNIMLGIMRKKKVMDLDQLMQSAMEQDIRFMVCTTSMTIMGLDKRDIAPLPNIHYGGVASFVDAARGAGMSLVF